jgi:glycolate oxidase FAD binding subunit
VAPSSDPGLLAAAAPALAHAPLEADCLDLWWNAAPVEVTTTDTGVTLRDGPATGAGAVLVRFGSADPYPRAEEAAAVVRRIGGLTAEIDDDDMACWEAQRAAQRSDIVVKVSALPAALPAAIAATQALDGTLVARAGLGLAWIELPSFRPAVAPGADDSDEGTRRDTADVVAAVEDLRRRLAPAPCVVLDAPADVRAMLDPWGGETGPVELMRKVKERFDPAGVCAPGLFVGGI